MNELQLKSAERELKGKKLDEMLAKLQAGTATPEDKTAIKALNVELSALNEAIKELKEIQDIALSREQARLDNASVDGDNANLLGRSNTNAPNNGGAEAGSFLRTVTVPAVCCGARPKHLMKATNGNIEEARKVAYTLVQYVLATMVPNEQVRAKAAAWCQKNGIVLRAAQSENNNLLGGFLIPIELANFIISLMEEYGIARQYMKVIPMAGDTKNVPRRAGTIKGYWLTDNAAITASTKQWDMVGLVAKKLAALVYFSNELSDDAAVNIGDDLAEEIAWAFSGQEDLAAFNGDGTSQYGGVIGLSTAMVQANGTRTTTGQGGITVGSSGSGSSWGSYHMSDFTATQATLPAYVSRRGRPSWYCSQQFYYGTMVNLAAAAGGNTILSITHGPDKEPIFLGRPVVFVEVMTLAPGTSQIDCYYGDLSLSSTLGDRKQLQISYSSEIGFANDQLAIRGITRVDIVNHDVGGNQANTLCQNVKYDQTGTTYYGGPIVALQSYNS